MIREELHRNLRERLFFFFSRRELGRLCGLTAVTAWYRCVRIQTEQPGSHQGKPGCLMDVPAGTG